MRRVFYISILLVMLAVALARAQSPIRIQSYPSQPADSADIAYYGREHFGRAALTVSGLNLAVWTYDRYIQKADFAKISFRSIIDNIKEGFNWDNDRLGTNMFLHPYHGNLYYNSARANGFNYWKSGLFAFAGSAMWELFLENEYPSTNDIIATPIGGMAIGEVTFRASDLVLKDNTRGMERFGREAAAFLISPMRGITRIINGDAWRYRPTSGRLFGIPEIDCELSLGFRAVGIQNRVFDRGGGLNTELNIEYGDRFELRSTQPYDFFTFKLSLNIQRSQPLLGQLNIMGRLISREIIDTKTQDLSVGAYQHFDYYDSDTLSTKSAKTPYKLAVPASVGVGFMYRNIAVPNLTIDAFAHCSGILLGGLLSDHYDLDDRNYNLASGFSVKAGINFTTSQERLSFALGYDYYRMFTWGYPRGTDMATVNPRTLNAQGDASVAFFGVAKFRADYRFSKHFFLTATFHHYLRSTRYRDFPNVRSSSFATRLLLTYEF